MPLLNIFYLYAQYEIEDTHEYATRLGTAISFRPMPWYRLTHSIASSFA